MTAKANPRKATPKAPPVVYVEIDESGNSTLVNQDPTDAEDTRDPDNRLARYKFDNFVKVEFEAVVSIIAG